MPRKPRIDLPGYLYHVIIRGIERRPIFKDRKDYQEFLTRLETIIDDCGGKCFAWALMSNHAHLLVRSGGNGLAEMMRRLLTGYAVYFNIRHKRAGHLFQNRYKSTLCDSDEYFKPLVRYIHLNPLKAKIVRNLDELKAYPWTGHKALIEDIPLSWYDHGSVLSLFGKDMQEARKNYLQFLRDGFQEDVDFEGGGLLRSKGHGKGMIITGTISDYQLFDERILGDNEFIKGIYSAGAIDDNEDESNQKEKMTIEEIIDYIAAKHNISRDALLKKNVNRTATKVRPIIAYLGVNKLGLTNTKVSKILNVSNSNICKMLMKNKKSFEAYGQMSIGEIIGK